MIASSLSELTVLHSVQTPSETESFAHETNPLNAMLTRYCIACARP